MRGTFLLVLLVICQPLLFAQATPADLMAARGSLALKRFSDAFTLFQAAHELDPGSASALAGMEASLVDEGAELFIRGKTEEARKRLLQALEYDPGSAPVVPFLAMLTASYQC